jgi:hypothetical protein
MYKNMLFFLASAFLIGVVGHFAFHDDQEEFKRYTEMVCKGAWPNYKKIEVNCD